MFFVIPEMPSETFVMLYKKLPDHFKDKKFSILLRDCYFPVDEGMMIQGPTMFPKELLRGGSAGGRVIVMLAESD